MFRKFAILILAIATVGMGAIAVVSLRVPRNHPDAVFRFALWQSRRTWLALDVARGHARMQLAQSTSVDLSHGVWVSEPSPHHGFYAQWGEWNERTRMSWIGFDLWIGMLVTGAYPLAVGVRRILRGPPQVNVRQAKSSPFSGDESRRRPVARRGFWVAGATVLVFLLGTAGILTLRHAMRTQIDQLRDFIGAQGGVVFRQKIQLARAHSSTPSGHGHTGTRHESHGWPRLGVADTPRKLAPPPKLRVFAGEDAKAVVGVPYRLNATVEHRAPVDFWVADGDIATENKVVMYHADRGLSSIGPLRTSTNWLYGWPSDLNRVGDKVYGIETWFKQLYTLNVENGVVAPVGASNDFEHVTCLAYDAEADLFYGVDTESRCLIAIDRGTGFAACLRVLPLIDVLGAAYDEGARTLYLYSRRTKSIYAIDPLEGAPVVAVKPNHGREGYYDELQFFAGHLYGVFAYFVDKTRCAQVRQIDLATGATMDVGPEIPDMSAHSLLINSMPEDVHWNSLDGPGEVVFSDATALDTAVTFSTPGTYVLRLNADGFQQNVHDDISITVAPHLASKAITN